MPKTKKQHEWKDESIPVGQELSPQLSLKLLFIDTDRQLRTRSVVIDKAEDALPLAVAEASDFDNGIYGFCISSVSRHKKNNGVKFGKWEAGPMTYFGSVLAINDAIATAPSNKSLQQFQKSGFEFVARAPVAGIYIYSPLRYDDRVVKFNRPDAKVGRFC
jgi:hypothetical protein